MLDINIRQNQKIGLAFGLLAAMAAVLGIVVYVQKIKHDKETRALNALDKEIKSLQLKELRQKSGG